MNFRIFLKLTIGLLAAGLLLWRPQAVQAQAAESCQQATRYLDLDGDGQAEEMLLACQFTPDGRDQLAIYKSAGKFLTDIPWQQNITYEDETWVFDHGSKGKASLIIRFSKVGDTLIAELYDDQNQDGQVSYQTNNGKVAISESQYWTVQVKAADGWWLRKDVLNYNLQIKVDGNVETMAKTESFRSLKKIDGKADYDIQIYDQNQNGKPEFDRRKLLTDFPPEIAGLGTQMTANWADDELPIRGGFSLWPYLDLDHIFMGGSRIVKGYQNSPPPIQFEPASGRIEAVGEFVASRGGEHNCYYYSGIAWVDGVVNQADNENPACFYDLAADGDGMPELQVRASYWPPQDANFPGSLIPVPLEWIRYSWDQGNSGSWRYAVGLIGRHLLDSPVYFPNVAILSMPYDSFPGWVTSQNWDMAVFSEFTGKQFWNSEGNPSVSYAEETQFADYFAGRSASMPAPDVQPQVDFKVEWAINTQKQPYLYFSPVDHHLHLLGAGGGTWKMDDSHSIRYQNLDGGDYINLWTFETNGAPEKTLVVLKDVLVLSGNNSVTIRHSQPPSSQFMTLPPANHAEWVKLGQDLASNEPTFAPDDFNAMAEQFAGASDTISGASLRNFRLSEGGFRFVLELSPGYTVEGADWSILNGRAPGSYVVSFDGAAYHLQPLTPAEVEIAAALQFAPAAPLSAYANHKVQVTLRNPGLEDAQQVAVELGAVQAGGPVEWSEPQMVRLLAGEEKKLLFDWAPSHPGAWQLLVSARLLKSPRGELSLTTSVEDVEVAEAQQTNLQQEISAFGLVEAWQVAALVICLILAACLAVWALLRAASIQPE